MALQFWLELMVRSGALLLAGRCLCRLLGPPALRHRFLVCLFGILTLFPLLAILLPEIPVQFWLHRDLQSDSIAIYQYSGLTRAQSPHAYQWPLLIWLIGVTTSAIPLAIGTIRVWSLSRHTAELSDLELAAVAGHLAGRIPVLLCDTLRIPMTCGLWKPRILLPSVSNTWSAGRLEVVLLHELAHIRRRHLASQLFVYLVSVLWWFQPLVWLLRRDLRLQSELAADSDAASRGVRASDYASELLAVAAAAPKIQSYPSLSISMVKPDDLEMRLRAVLQPGNFSQPGWKLYAAVVVLATCSYGASALNVRSDERGSTMKRTILSALLTSTGLTAATVSGTIHDSNGATVADAKVSMINPDKATKQEAVTDPSGKFSFNGREGGQYILRVEKPGFSSIFREYDLKADSLMNRDFTMTTEGSALVVDNPANQPRILKVGGEVAQSNLITKVNPIYPAAAKKAGVQGTVELATTISRDGIPVEVRVVSSPSDDLSESALEAVRQWRYRPILLNGNPVDVEAVVVINYTLAK